MELFIKRYCDELSEKWDDFVQNQAINGTFLNSRSFLSYHPDTRFKDHSLIIYKNNEILALIPACEIYEDEEKNFFSHKGSTFGGIILNKKFNDIKHVDFIFNKLNEYVKASGFNNIIIKNVSDIFCENNSNLIEYFLFKDGYNNYSELSFYIDFYNYKEDILSNFTASKRRDYKYSVKNNLEFKQITIDKEIKEFYNILVMGLEKHDTKPVHTYEELLDFKNNRLKNIVEFYGVFYDNKIIAGSMIFKFKNQVFHTQYLAADSNYLKVFPMNFLNYNLIKTAKEKNFNYFSFGISTEEKGTKLNYNLGEFKEGFGTTYSINRTFYKKVL